MNEMQINEFMKTYIKLEVFKAQDYEKGKFDVTFVVEGKKLFAHKTALISKSVVFEAMLSDRWNNKDGIIKLETCSYENFFLFLSTLYGYVPVIDIITDDNIFEMIDIAEYFDIQKLKRQCDFILSFKEKRVEDIEKLFDIADKYSLHQFKLSLGNVVSDNFEALFTSDNFIRYTKEFVEFICYKKPKTFCEKKYLSAVYKGAEHQVMKRQQENMTARDSFEAIETELKPILKTIDFRRLDNKTLSKSVFQNLYFESEAFNALSTNDANIDQKIKIREIVAGEFGTKCTVVINFFKTELEKVEYDSDIFPRTLIFCNFDEYCEKLANALCYSGINAMSLNKICVQDLREKTLHDFQKKKISCLVVTDLCAQKIDVNELDLTINFDVPPDYETYVKRIKLTHRHGKCYSFGKLGKEALILVEIKEGMLLSGHLIPSGEIEEASVSKSAQEETIKKSASIENSLPSEEAEIKEAPADIPSPTEMVPKQVQEARTELSPSVEISESRVEEPAVVDSLPAERIIDEIPLKKDLYETHFGYDTSEPPTEDEEDADEW